MSASSEQRLETSTARINSTGIEPIQRTDLVAMVTESLRRQILDQVYPPGAELPAQSKLATLYNVSVNVIREALRNLRSLGMVEVSQGRCPQVKHMGAEASIDAFSVMLSQTNASLYQLMEARAPLEIRVATLAAERATPDDVAEITRAFENMTTANDAETASRCDRAFHRSLAAATKNPLLVAMVETLSGLQTFLTRDAYNYMGIKESAVTEHAAILKAVQDHDAQAAAQLMLQHLEAVHERIPRNLDPAAPLPPQELPQIELDEPA